MGSTNYLNNKEFESTIKLYLKDNEKYEQKLIILLTKLIDNIMTSLGPAYNVDLEDMKQDCFYIIFRILKNFKPEKGTAFNYFSTIIINHLKSSRIKNKKYEIKLKNYMEQNKDKLLE